MADFLSDPWFDELAAAAAQARPPEGVRVVLQQVVSDDASAGARPLEVAYALRVGDGRVEVVRGTVPDADVTFRLDRATAAAIARGELSAQAAFLAGRLRIGGDVHRFGGAAEALADLADVFGQVRASTRW
ncbi:MAG: SCP2 sterol-binding domain-containing protein [Acidimicrobiia bacterium]